MWEKKSIVYHFENHIVTQRSSQHAYSLGALVRELILKMRKCNVISGPEDHINGDFYNV